VHGCSKRASGSLLLSAWDILKHGLCLTKVSPDLGALGNRIDRKTDDDGLGIHDCQRGFLADHDIEDWIRQSGRFAAIRTPSSQGSGKSLSYVRLLLCEREGWQPLNFPMSQASFIEVEKAFGLPRATLPLLSRNAGTESYRLGFGRSEDGERVLQSICRL